MVRIAEVSGGNPFYALEMARTIDTEPDLPRSLSDLVRLRITGLDHDTQDALLAAACVAEPTVDMLARATGTTAERMATLLEEVESRGILEITGNRVCYAHPLLARGVYVDASAARRRRMHRAVADVVDQPELKARHLALATSRNDPEILKALDDAANARTSPRCAGGGRRIGRSGNQTRRWHAIAPAAVSRPPLPCRGRRSGLRLWSTP